MPSKKGTNPSQNPSHWAPGSNAKTWASGRGKGGGDGGRGATNQEYGQTNEPGEQRHDDPTRGRGQPPRARTGKAEPAARSKNLKRGPASPARKGPARRSASGT